MLNELLHTRELTLDYMDRIQWTTWALPKSCKGIRDVHSHGLF